MKLTLIDKKEEIPGVTTFIWKTDEDFTWKAGQLLHYTLPHENPDDRGIERFFTISYPPSGKNITITTRFAGEKGSSFKRALFSLPIGGEIEADNLEGDFTVEDPSEEYVFIAGGIGITPFHSILLELDAQNLPINVKLLYANRDENFVFKEELDALAEKHPNFKIRYFVEPLRIDKAAIREEVPDLSRPIFYVSGPEPMVIAFEKMLGEMGIPAPHIKRDEFPGYDKI